MDDPIIDLQREGYEIRIHETEDGFLVYWGDYVANTWVEATETLAEALALGCLIDVDGYLMGIAPQRVLDITKKIQERKKAQNATNGK